MLADPETHESNETQHSCSTRDSYTTNKKRKHISLDEKKRKEEKVEIIQKYDKKEAKVNVSNLKEQRHNYFWGTESALNEPSLKCQCPALDSSDSGNENDSLKIAKLVEIVAGSQGDKNVHKMKIVAY